MERPERNEKDDAQKAKLIFISLGVLVAILLIWSFFTANTARQERDKARQETAQVRQEKEQLDQMMKEQNFINDDLRKKLQACESRPKPKPVVKKTATKSTKKKSSKSKKTH